MAVHFHYGVMIEPMNLQTQFSAQEFDQSCILYHLRVYIILTTKYGQSSFQISIHQSYVTFWAIYWHVKCIYELQFGYSLFSLLSIYRPAPTIGVGKNRFIMKSEISPARFFIIKSSISFLLSIKSETSPRLIIKSEISFRFSIKSSISSP